MRAPPDLGGRKDPPRRHNAEGPIRKNTFLKHPIRVKSRNQRLASFPTSPSVHVLAAEVRDDPWLPIRLRVLGLGVSHRLRYGGKIDPGDERRLRRLSAERRRRLAALWQAYR